MELSLGKSTSCRNRGAEEVLVDAFPHRSPRITPPQRQAPAVRMLRQLLHDIDRAMDRVEATNEKRRTAVGRGRGDMGSHPQPRTPKSSHILLSPAAVADHFGSRTTPKMACLCGSRLCKSLLGGGSVLEADLETRCGRRRQAGGELDDQGVVFLLPVELFLAVQRLHGRHRLARQFGIPA